jgi:threonine/homoserine/homoserine lactone efflux protein
MMFDSQYGLALLMGLVFSFPFGPMGMLAMSQWVHGHKRAARAIVYGICAGDLVIIAAVLVGIQVVAKVEIPRPLLAAVLAGAAYLLWRETGSHRHAFTYRGPLRRFLLAFGVTLVQPSNWALCWGVYGLGTGYLVQTYRHMLPTGVAALEPVASLSAGETLLVLVFQLLGMAAGWVFYAILLGRYRSWKKMPRHPMPMQVKPSPLSMWVGRGASVFVLGCALLLMVQSMDDLMI